MVAGLGVPIFRIFTVTCKWNLLICKQIIIVHPKHIFQGKYTCILMPWGCHGVISSTV